MAKITIILGTDSDEMAKAAVRMADGDAECIIFPEVVDGLPLHPSKHATIAETVIRGREDHADVVCCTHSEMIVLRIRRRIAEGSLKAEDVALVWVGEVAWKTIQFRKDGDTDDWPEVNGVPVFSEDFEEAVAIRVAHGTDEP